jgi:hypothetical protein
MARASRRLQYGVQRLTLNQEESMFTSRQFKSAVMAMGLAVMIAAAPAAAGRGDQKKGGQSLEGTWWVDVTLRDCATGAARATFPSLLAFAKGGTLTETTGNALFQPGQRTGGFGSWSRGPGHTFRVSSDAFIMFDSAPTATAPPFRRGVQRIAQTVDMRDGSDTFTSVATVRFYDTAGVLLTSGCATAAGHRY